MSTVVVTGGLGNVGTWVIDQLDQSGWDVVCIDLSTPSGAGPGGTEVGGIEFRSADLSDHAEAWELINAADPEAVVHMAAIPMPGLHADSRTFKTNVTSTYNVMTAAGRVGADIVWTSSNAIYGTVFADPPWVPDYFPIDEEHPQRPEDPYGGSKLLGEKTAEITSRRYDISVASLRPSLIQVPGAYQTREVRSEFDPSDVDKDGGYWSYVDVRDVATAVEAALDAEFNGHEPFVIAAENNYLDRPTATVIEEVYGEQPTECSLQGDESAYSTAKAQSEIGWVPEHDWRTAEEEDQTRPSFE